MRFNHLLQIFACLLISLSSQLVRAEPMLNGIGVHQELGQEVFIGALFSESLSNDADTLINNVQPMRMELKVVTPDGLTTRRFSRMWIEGMAVNSKADALTAQADNMVKFDSLFKGRFLNGDYITFTNTPGKGVDIAVNSGMSMQRYAAVSTVLRLMAAALQTSKDGWSQHQAKPSQ
jgi:protein TonB